MSKNFFNNKTIFVTGGTGSFGKSFLNFVVKNYRPKKFIIFSRDEFKQFELANKYPESKYPFLRFFLGDVRDRERLNLAMKGVDYVIHAAALKQVPAAEYNPMEFVNTNIYGAENIVNASINQRVKKVIALSTDKAANPINLYGATKLVSDKIFIAANNIIGKNNIKFSIVRYGNVLGSRGSVVPFFKNLVKENATVLPITDERMTRFWITLDEAVKFVQKSFLRMQGGEIFVPKIPSVKIVDLAKSLKPSVKLKIVGIRPGEKIHELMCPNESSEFTIEFKDHYVISPINSNMKNFSKFLKNPLKERGKKVRKDFEYSSGENKFLSLKEIKKLNKK